MAILPVRDLGSVGVITDVAPYNVPLNGFTTAVNVRFDEGKVRRAPIFRKVKDSLGFTPRHAFGIVPATGYDTVVMVSDDFAIHEYNAGTLTNRSGSISGSSDPRPFTTTQLADVVYINRPDRVPVFRGPAGTNFASTQTKNGNYVKIGDVVVCMCNINLSTHNGGTGTGVGWRVEGFPFITMNIQGGAPTPIFENNIADVCGFGRLENNSTTAMLFSPRVNGVATDANLFFTVIYLTA